MLPCKNVAGVEGLEPPTLGLEIRCSIQLSYTPERTYTTQVFSASVVAPVSIWVSPSDAAYSTGFPKLTSLETASPAKPGAR